MEDQKSGTGLAGIAGACELQAGIAAIIDRMADDSRNAFIRLFDEIDRIHTVDIPAWLESHDMPRDITLAIQVALAELGEFATAQDVEDVPTDNAIELIRVVIAKKKWEIGTAAKHSSAVPPAPDDANPAGDPPPPPPEEPTFLDLIVNEVAKTVSRNGLTVEMSGKTEQWSLFHAVYQSTGNPMPSHVSERFKEVGDSRSQANNRTALNNTIYRLGIRVSAGGREKWVLEDTGENQPEK